VHSLRYICRLVPGPGRLSLMMAITIPLVDSQAITEHGVDSGRAHRPSRPSRAHPVHLIPSLSSPPQIAIEAISDIPATHQRLIHKGKVLKDEEGLTTYTIDNDSTVHLVRAPSATTTSAPPASTHTVPPPPSSTTPAPPFPPPTGSGATNPFAALMGAGGGLGGPSGSAPPFQAGSNPMFGGLGMGPGGFPSAQEQQRMQQQLMQVQGGRKGEVGAASREAFGVEKLL
jgi:hypothetical protein